MLKVSDILYTSWEEIPFRKLKVILQILPLIRWDNHTSASNTYAKNFLLKQLFKSKKIYLATTPEQRVDLFTQELGWIQEFSTHFPIKSYRLGNKTFHAPAEALADIDVERLMEADVALYRFIHSQKNHYLGHFLAMLYTVKGEVLTDGVIDTNAALLSKIPAHEAIAHIRSFIGSFTQLRKVCSTLFPNDFDSAQSDGSKSHPERSRGAGDPSRAWQKMLFELSNTPGYPGMHLAKQARAWEALPYFDAEQLKISQQIDRLKNTGTK